ncbi:MAG: cytidine deaminase [Chitinophagaceae bacterium]
MKKNSYKFEFEVYESINDLPEGDAKLLAKARKTTETAYAPYSHFFVGAAAMLKNGKVVTGTNQENASYPVSICAERSLLSSASALYPEVAVETMAISYHNYNDNANSNRPISPCGMCRQSLVEYEGRWKNPIRLILSGIDGKVYVISKASHLLPLGFTGDDLK